MEEGIKIKIQGSLYLESDHCCYFIVKYGKDEEGKQTRTVLGYYSTLEGALTGYTKKLLKTCGAKTLGELVDAIYDIKKTIRETEFTTTKNQGA